MDYIFMWIVAFVLGFWIFKKINQWKRLPPGPWGLPVVGYLPYIDRHYPHLTLTELSKQYGPIYSLQMGSVYTVVLSDHRLIREAFSKDAFSGRAPLYLTHGIMKGNGLICAEGALWKDQRKLVTTWLKSFGMSKHGVAREKLAKRISSGVPELIQNVKESHGTPIPLPNMISNALGNVINDVIFGFKFPLDDKTWNWLREIQEEGCHEMGVAGVVNFLPFVRLISSSTQKTMDVLTRGQAQTHRLYASVIATRRKMLGLEVPLGAEYKQHENIFNEHPEGFVKCIKYSKHASNTEVHYFDPKVLIPSKDECILDSFLYEQKRRYENGEENAHFVRDEQMYYLLADMFGAGLDTSAVTFSWALLYLALYAEVQEKVRQEILSVYPEECEVDGAKLPYLMAVICETQRIRSITPVGIPHGSVQDTDLGNYRIPKGTMVIPLQWAIHMDPNGWSDPECFNPNRFIDENGELLKPQEFIPFQADVIDNNRERRDGLACSPMHGENENTKFEAHPVTVLGQRCLTISIERYALSQLGHLSLTTTEGKRMCPGDELSRMLSVGFMARLLRAFRIRLSSEPPTAEQMKGEVGIALTPPKVLYICDHIKHN